MTLTADTVPVNVDAVALHLRAMNMLYEGLKEKGALMLIPSSAVESMGMGGVVLESGFCGADSRLRGEREAIRPGFRGIPAGGCGCLA